MIYFGSGQFEAAGPLFILQIKMISLFGGLRKLTLSQQIISLQPRLHCGTSSLWCSVLPLTPFPFPYSYSLAGNLCNVLQSDVKDVASARIIGEVMELVSDLKRKNVMPRMVEQEDSWKKIMAFLNAIPNPLLPVLETINDRVAVSNLIDIKCFYADMVMRQFEEISLLQLEEYEKDLDEWLNGEEEEERELGWGEEGEWNIPAAYLFQEFEAHEGCNCPAHNPRARPQVPFSMLRQLKDMNPMLEVFSIHIEGDCRAAHQQQLQGRRAPFSKNICGFVEINGTALPQTHKLFEVKFDDKNHDNEEDNIISSSSQSPPPTCVATADGGLSLLLTIPPEGLAVEYGIEDINFDICLVDRESGRSVLDPDGDFEGSAAAAAAKLNNDGTNEIKSAEDVLNDYRRTSTSRYQYNGRDFPVSSIYFASCFDSTFRRTRVLVLPDNHKEEEDGASAPHFIKTPVTINWSVCKHPLWATINVQILQYHTGGNGFFKLCRFLTSPGGVQSPPHIVLFHQDGADNGIEFPLDDQLQSVHTAATTTIPLLRPGVVVPFLYSLRLKMDLFLTLCSSSDSGLQLPHNKYGSSEPATVVEIDDEVRFNAIPGRPKWKKLPMNGAAGGAEIKVQVKFIYHHDQKMNKFSKPVAYAYY
ncbi:unnamed protein product [Cuscuta epithymum]|uniref:Uncharacterized protein n=1 Tax=Cuscuta epithymum TaxID=186058 RepID=A0AAV0DW22_9ASTE|nr:unnamed protein product [Cuscuta epithymum]